GRTAGLDGARGGVGTTHEGDRAGGGAAGGEELLGGADAGEVQAGAGAALEDEALLLVPVEDRLHRVVDGEDEAGRHLLRARGADVEPDRGVEREVLVHEEPGDLVLEDLGVGVGGEVAVLLAGVGVGLDHAVDELLEAPLTRVGADRTPEVLGGDDRGGVDRPEVGELDAALLEDCLAGLPVGLDDVATLPVDLVVGVHALGAEDALDGQPARLLARLAVAHGLRHSVQSPSVRSCLVLVGNCPGAAGTTIWHPARSFPTTCRVGLGQPVAAGWARSMRSISISASKSSADSKAR